MSKTIFLSSQKEYDGFRKRLVDYLNQPNKFFMNNGYRSLYLDDIHEFSFDTITGMDCYFIVCTVNRGGKKETQSYSIDPKVLVNFFRQEKLRQIKTKVNV